jgi:hypothetical protein
MTDPTAPHGGPSASIVMYHYVRPLRGGGRFAALKGLELDLFREQLDYLQARYTPVGWEELLDLAASPGARRRASRSRCSRSTTG